MTTNSKVVQAFHSVFKGEASASLFLPVNPVPASRPRVTRWGVYYGKKYTQWRKDVEKYLSTIIHEQNLTGPLCVLVENFVLKPKTSKKTHPRGDVDNYAKAPLDAVTSHTEIWGDDDQIVCLLITKQFTEDEPGTQITVYKDD
jgi:Holliday junction resolvase RusA-like endonuclease